MDSPTYKKIVRKLAIKHNLTYMEAKEIVNSQFYLVAEVMKTADRKTADFKNIRLPEFGKFYVKPERIKFLRKLNNGETNKNPRE